MENTREELKRIIDEHKGVFTTADFESAGIARYKLKSYVESGYLIRLSHGLYALADGIPDEYKVIQSHSGKLIFSYATALYLHGILKKPPRDMDITVPQGDNVNRVKKCHPNTCFHYCKKEHWELGITTAVTPAGYEVRAYDLERCICDLIKDKTSIETETYVAALKKYFAENCNADRILAYAKRMRVNEKVRMYMEVLQ